MPAFFHPDYADGGPDMLRTRAATAGRIRLRVLGTYAAGNAYGTVVAATLGLVTLSPADITSAGAEGSTRQHTLAAKAVQITAGDDGAGMHWAITDETDLKVLVAGPGASDVTPVEAGGTLTSAAFVFSSHAQPAAQDDVPPDPDPDGAAAQLDFSNAANSQFAAFHFTAGVN